MAEVASTTMTMKAMATTAFVMTGTRESNVKLVNTNTPTHTHTHPHTHPPPPPPTHTHTHTHTNTHTHTHTHTHNFCVSLPLPLPYQLQWFQFVYRIKFKSGHVTYLTLSTHQLIRYLPLILISPVCKQLHFRKTKLTSGKRAFL